MARVETLSHGMRPLSLALSLPYTLTSHAGILVILDLVSRSMASVATDLGNVLAIGAWTLPISFYVYCIRCLW